jgi:hypothetical protein
MRKDLCEGEHWDVVNGIGVVFSEAGVAAMSEMLATKKEGAVAEKPAQVEKVAEAIEAVVVEKKKKVALRCVRADFRNRRIVDAVNGEARVRVRVRNADLYVPGMLFEGIHVGGDLFEESRAPRGRGLV